MATKSKKTFNIGTAGLFFGRSPEWIRHQERVGNFTDENGVKIEPTRHAGEKDGILMYRTSREYTFDDIEIMADALRRNRVISKYKHERVMNAVTAMRKVAG